MKISFTAKIRLIILLLFLISLVQGLIILQLIWRSDSIEQLTMDVQNSLYITIFLQFILVVILIFYIPIFLRRSFLGIHRILKEISKGTYDIDIDMKNFETSLDKEFYAVVRSIVNMLESLAKFDRLKKGKIIEQHNRILALLKLTEQGFIIIDQKGKIIYINDIVSEFYPSLQAKVVIPDNNFVPELENNLKKYVKTILDKQTKADYKQYYTPNLKRHIGLNCAIIRDSEGKMQGAVIIITNLGKKKPEKQRSQDTGDNREA